ncbi:MAG: protein tyrosine phosphatase [Alphaproteobacteria bacterium]|nr:protein tyrosine phosphatase [Alphaproteobacteria bacterium]
MPENPEQPPPSWLPEAVVRVPGRMYRSGTLFYYGGVLTFAASVGAAVGFFASDFGVPWLPDMVSTVLAVCVVSLLFVILGRWLRGKAFTETPGGVRVSRRLILGMGVVSLLLAGNLWVYRAAEPSPLTSLSEEEYETAFAQDLQHYQEFDAGMDRLLRILEAEPVFASDAPLTAEHEAMLRSAWASVYDYAFALDNVRYFHHDWYRFDISRQQRRYHLRSFLLAFASELALYEKSKRLTALVLRNHNVRRFLDAPHPELGMPENTFSVFRQELHGARDEARIVAGEQYLRVVLEEGFGARVEAKSLGVGWLWDAVERHLWLIERHSLVDRTTTTVRGDLQVLRRAVRRRWFPLQAGLSEWFGDTRVRRIGWYLITPEQQEALDPDLRTGDILVSRKNWYLSNIGLPGFWPHAILYLGDPEKLAASLDEDPAVLAWVEQELGEPMTFTQLLARRYPRGWATYVLGEHGEPFRVMEAISEGVVFNTLAHASGDYLAAMRPRLDALARAQAINEAFRHLEKPYDFDFDFATDHAIVCTELVWRAYRPEEGKEGLDLPLVEVAGRHTLPANELVKLYAEQRDTPQQQLDFVAFLDAREREGVAVIADEAAFAASHERVKWDVAQK